MVIYTRFELFKKKLEKKDVGEIFTPNAVPIYTYIPRSQFELENKFGDTYKFSNNIIVITGDSKSGKTVLWKKIIGKKYIQIDAIRIKNSESIWENIAQKQNLALSQKESSTISKSQTAGGKIKGKLDALFASTEGEVSGSETKGEIKTIEKEKNYSAYDLVINELLTKKITLVIEDFHYIDESEQKEIVRSIKNPLLDGLKVIILAVPHRVSDVIKSERDLQGRVYHLEIPKWNDDEIAEIAKKGFNELGVKYSQELVEDLVKESFSNPEIMQDLCLQLCLSNNIREQCNDHIEIKFPNNDKGTFFSEFAKNFTTDIDYKKIISKGRVSGRTIYNFEDGTSGDIYVGVLKIIPSFFPKLEINSKDIQLELDKIVIDENKPQLSQITQCIHYIDDNLNTDDFESLNNHLLEYDPVLKKLIIMNPYFAFNLKWGNHEL